MKFKLSYYTFFSNPVDETNSRVVYSTRSGLTMLITKTCYEFLTNDLIEYVPESIREVLIKNQVLVAEDENELELLISENINAGKMDENVLYEVIQPTAMCQLGCYYCGQKHSKDYLEEDIRNKIVERIILKFRNGHYKAIYIGWFGAEPLMGLPQMRYIYRRLKETLNDDTIKIKGKVVTNGMSLKENIFLELVTDLKIDFIEVTLDGIAEFHDKHRYTKSGENSFDIIYGNLKNILLKDDFKKHGCEVSIRCNVDEKNEAGVIPLINLIAKDNLHTKISRFYFAQIYSWGQNDAHLNSLAKEEGAKKQLIWEIEKIKLGYRMDRTLYSRKTNTCIATGGSSELYDAFGNVYNCTEVSYADVYEGTNYKLGNLKTDHKTTFTEKPHNDWFEIVRDTEKYPCHFCKLLPVCGGACPKSWAEGNMACPPFKYNIIKEIELKYLLRKTEPEKLNDRLNTFISDFKQDDFKRIGK